MDLIRGTRSWHRSNVSVLLALPYFRLIFKTYIHVSKRV